MEVSREWNGIDILLRDEKHQLAVAIENKIDTGEHSDQLQRYRQILNAHFCEWNTIGIYLTPEGDTPSEETFLPVDYGLLTTALEDVVDNSNSRLNSDVLVTTRHYIQMLRSHIVTDSEIAKLCVQIYQKHKEAIDRILEHRPDRLATISSFLQSLITSIPELVPDTCTKAYIRFCPKEWDIPIFQQGRGWTPSNRMLLFEFQNYDDALKLKLIIGPGPSTTREEMFRLAQRENLVFKPVSKSLTKKWAQIFDRAFISYPLYDEASDEEVKSEIQKQWKAFVDTDLPKISSTIRSQLPFAMDSASHAR